MTSQPNRIESKTRIINTMNNIPIFSNSVIVYDIDNTLLDDYGNNIQPIVDTYHYALEIGLKPVIITARQGNDQNITYTINQLKQNGIDNFKYIYFMPPDKTDPVRYKTESRKSLFNKGYRVAMSIGDMYWDIGEYGGIGFIV